MENGQRARRNGGGRLVEGSLRDALRVRLVA